MLLVVNPRIDLTGKRYGRFVVVGQADDFICKDGKRRSQWLCKCDCGNIFVSIGSNITRGNTNSCGCYANEVRENNIKNCTTHGMTRTRLYRIWSNMKGRCCNRNNHNWCDYGGRGIKICEEWKNDFKNFKEWAINNGYDDNLSIDRINNDGNYEPGNCRWASRETQVNNRRVNVYVEIDGESKTLAQWADMIGYSRSIFHARAKLYKTSIDEQVKILVRQYKSTQK